MKTLKNVRFKTFLFLSFAFIFISFGAVYNVKAGPFLEWLLSGPTLGDKKAVHLEPLGESTKEVDTIAEMVVGKWDFAKFLSLGFCECRQSVFEVLGRGSDGKKLDSGKNIAQFKICNGSEPVGYLQVDASTFKDGNILLETSYFIDEKNQNKKFATNAVKTFIEELCIKKGELNRNGKETAKISFFFKVDQQN